MPEIFNAQQDEKIMTQDAVFLPSGREQIIVMKTPPSIPKLFTEMIRLSMIRPITTAPDMVLEKSSVVYPNVIIEPEKVGEFKKMCGYAMGRSDIPAPFIQSLFIGMMSRFISSSFFPISPMGLIQTGQSFDLIRPAAPGMKLDLYCRIVDMTRTAKGIISRFFMEAAPAGNDPEAKAFSEPEEKEPVWQGIATYLTRSKTRKAKGKKPSHQEPPLPVREIIDVPGNTGRRYAAVSGDFNPHHLHTWTARPMGFKHPIAHGIWSMARAGASLEKAAGHPTLTSMDGEFKLPIFMPGRITLGYTFSETNARFELRDKAKGVPHLKGSFRFSPTKI